MDSFNTIPSFVVYAVVMILFIMLVRWLTNRERSLKDEEAQRTIYNAQKRAKYDEMSKKEEGKKEKRNTFFVNPKGEAKRGACE